MYEHVIVGINGRQGGRDAAALAAGLAGSAGVRALVFVAGTLTGAGAAATVDVELADARALPEQMADEQRLAGGAPQVIRVVAETVGAGLEAAGEDHDADLIVVGRSRRHGLARLSRGDDVSATLHRTPRAVAVAPPGFADGPWSPMRIGVAYDGSPQSLVALAHAGLLADARHADLLVRQVIEPDRDVPRGAVRPIRRGMRAAHSLTGQDPSDGLDGIHIHTVIGSCHARLVAFSREVDLLVCGSRRGGPVRRVVLGSTSGYLARHVDVPLLIAPPVDTGAIVRWCERRPAQEVHVS